MEQKQPAAVIEAAHRAHLGNLPFEDTRDFEDTDRGFIAALEPCVVKSADGTVVWDNDAYSFLDGDAPTSVHPSLWRQSQLCAKQGLYEVVPGIYQVRGLDISNISFIEGDSGVIVIDPLISTEVAAAAIGLYREHRGDRPVVAVIYTHSHGDHFGGVLGVTSQADVDAGKVAVLAPEGFVEHAVQENVYAGTAMTRRATYMYGTRLDRGPQGQVGCGLGQNTSTGEVALIVPTIDIRRTGETHTIDGVEIEFQMAPGTEAPAEMHFYFPKFRALCMAENATHTMHNLVTLRGAQVRDGGAHQGQLTAGCRARPDAEDQPPSADVVDGARHVGEQVRVAVTDAGDKEPDLGVRGDLTPRRERGPALEVGDVGLFVEQDGLAVDERLHRRAVEVVVTEDHVDAEVVGGQDGVAPCAVVGGTAGLDLHGDANGTGHGCSWVWERADF